MWDIDSEKEFGVNHLKFLFDGQGSFQYFIAGGSA